MEKIKPEGYLSLPRLGTGPPVLVLHAWWGLNETMKTTCDKLAAEGYSVFAPDLYHGRIAKTIAEAETLAQSLEVKHPQTRKKILEAAAFLRDPNTSTGSNLAVIGFSLGAYFALDLASVDPDPIHSVVLFYGTGEGDFTQSNASYLGHFAENDPYEPLSNVKWLNDALVEAGCPVTFYTYPGTGHWFFEPDRVEAYQPVAAEVAWERTQRFLNRHQETDQMEPDPDD